MSNRDFLNKYHDSEPYSFGGINQVQNYFDVNEKKSPKYCQRVTLIQPLRSLKDPVKLHQLVPMVQITFGKLI